MAAVIIEVQFAQIATVREDAPLERVIEARDEAEQGSLAGAGHAEDADDLPGSGFERHILQDRRILHIAESDALENNPAREMRGYERLYSLHGKRMKSVARNLLGSTADAEDAVQETFLKVQRSIKTFRAQSSFVTWTFRILVVTVPFIVFFVVHRLMSGAKRSGEVRFLQIPLAAFVGRDGRSELTGATGEKAREESEEEAPVTEEDLEPTGPPE